MIARDPQPLVGDPRAYVVSDVPGYRDDAGLEIGPRRIARRPAIRRVWTSSNGEELQAALAAFCARHVVGIVYALLWVFVLAIAGIWWAHRLVLQ